MQLLIYICVFLSVALISLGVASLLRSSRKQWSEEIRLFDTLVEQEVVKRVKMAKEKEVASKPAEVPKIIWRIWCEDGPYGKCGGRAASRYPWETTEHYAKGWTQKIFNQGDINDEREKWGNANKFLEENFPGENIAEAFKYINPAYGAAKADFLRYAIMYIHGGIYIDMKSCISDYIPEMPDGIDLITFQWGGLLAPQRHLFKGGEYVNWFLYARPRSKIMKEILDTTTKNILALRKEPYKSYQYNISSEALSPTGVSAKGLVLATTGPIMLSRIIRRNLKSENPTVMVLDKPIATYMCQPDESISGGHYSMAQGPLVYPSVDALYIPNTLHLFDGETSDVKGFEIVRHSMDDCVNFMKLFFNSSLRDYEELSKEDKIAIVKILLLYVYGGSIGPWDTMPDLKIPHTWYTVLDQKGVRADLFCTPPRNPILLDYTKDILDNHLRPRRGLASYISKAAESGTIKPGKNMMDNGWFIDARSQEFFTLHRPKEVPRDYHIYVINLRRSKDRRERMKKQLLGSPIPWTIVEAVDGQLELPKGHIPIKSRLKKGEIGCFLSHLKVYNNFLANPMAKKAIILEDDCDLPPGWWKNITRVCDMYIPNKSDFIHLDKKLFNFYNTVGSGNKNDRDWANATFPGRENQELRPKEVMHEHIIEAGPELGLVAYCINKRAAMILVSSLNNIEMPVDVQMHLPRIRNQIRWAKLKNNQINHGTFTSTVQNTTENFCTTGCCDVPLGF